RLERQDPAARVAEDQRPIVPGHRREDRGEVHDLALWFVRRAVAARPAATPVVADEGELRLEERAERVPGRSHGQPAVDDNGGGPRTAALEGDRRPVGRGDVLHGPNLARKGDTLRQVPADFVARTYARVRPWGGARGAVTIGGIGCDG